MKYNWFQIVSFLKLFTMRDRDAWQSIFGVIKFSCTAGIPEPRIQAFLDRSFIVKRFDGSTVNKPNQ
jgi:hypothetical protein